MEKSNLKQLYDKLNIYLDDYLKNLNKAENGKNKKIRSDSTENMERIKDSIWYLYTSNEDFKTIFNQIIPDVSSNPYYELEKHNFEKDISKILEHIKNIFLSIDK